MSLPLQTVAAVASASDPNRRDYGIGAPSGPAGRGIKDMTYDSPSGMVTVTFTDLFTKQLGPVRGEPGIPGADGEKGDTGLTGLTGAQGPLPWQAAQPWAANSAYTATPPASLVTYAGGVYVCAVDHGSVAAFDATKWVLVAAPGSTWRKGAGAPASSLGVDGDYYLNATTGDVLQRVGGAYAFVLNLVGPVGPVGPQSWQTPPVPWAANTAYSAVAPASVVTNAGTTYVCSVSHTSGATFDVTKWTSIAGKGDPGTGNVSGPTTSIDGEIVLMSGTGGSAGVTIKGSGKKLTDFATPGIPRTVRTSNTQLVAADKGKWYGLNGTFTQTFDTAANLGAGWSIFLDNPGTGQITIQPSPLATFTGNATQGSAQIQNVSSTAGLAVGQSISVPSLTYPFTSPIIAGCKNLVPSSMTGLVVGEGISGAAKSTITAIQSASVSFTGNLQQYSTQVSVSSTTSLYVGQVITSPSIGFPVYIVSISGSYIYINVAAPYNSSGSSLTAPPQITISSTPTSGDGKTSYSFTATGGFPAGSTISAISGTTVTVSSNYVSATASGVTFQPSNFIDGLTSYVMYGGEVRSFSCDGVNITSKVLNPFYATFTGSAVFNTPPGYTLFGGLGWGGGGGGGNGAGNNCPGGNGGPCLPFILSASGLPAQMSVIIGSGGQPTGAATNTPGGATSLGSVITISGALGGTSYSTNAAGGSAPYTSSGAPGTYEGGAGNPNVSPGPCVFGGGAGSSGNGTGGTSMFGGNGGSNSGGNGNPGNAPGGGGASAYSGAGAAGARGELRIWGIC